jgi:hypothetical protein
MISKIGRTKLIEKVNLIMKKWKFSSFNKKNLFMFIKKKQYSILIDSMVINLKKYKINKE